MDGTDMSDVAVASGMTVDELWALPDDGQRRELIDGELFVTPAPQPGHQVGSGRLYLALQAAAGDRLVLYAPVDLLVDDRTVVQPDLVVYDADVRRDLDPTRPIPRGTVPLVAIEISSPSTRRLDLVHKRELYERIGVPEHWFVDGDVQVVDVHDLRGGAERRTASGDERVPSRIMDLGATVASLFEV